MRLLKRIVGEEFAFDDEESLNAYSYDCSSIKIKPQTVLLPNNVEQLRRIIVHANQHKTPISIRGNGSGNRGGCLGKGIIICMKRFNRIIKLDTKTPYIEVQGGVTVSALNKVLKKNGFELPLNPNNTSTSIGSFIVRNGSSEESYKYGRVIDLLKQITYIDGTGKYNSYNKKEDFKKIVSWEGNTGIVISVKLKIIKISAEKNNTLDLIPFENNLELMKKFSLLKKREDIISIEYLNKKCSKIIDLKENPHLIILYNGDKGSYKDLFKIKEILGVRKNLHLILWQKNYRFMDDFSIKKNNFFELMKFCDEKEIPCYGSLGTELFNCGFTNEKEWKNSSLINLLKNLYVDFQGNNGFGLLKKDFVSKEKKSQLIMLKEKMDYNNLLNKGVIL